MGMRLPSVENLAREFARMPTIGRRTAQKLAFYVLRQSRSETESLVRAIRDVKTKISQCRHCFNIAEGDTCEVCADETRDRSLLCVVEGAPDLMALEKGGGFKGVYHVLGGALSPIDGVEASDLKIEELLRRIEDGVKEVIIATNPSSEGEATAYYLARLLERLPVKVTRIALGLPMGSELEFSDAMTLSRAMAGRKDING